MIELAGVGFEYAAGGRRTVAVEGVTLTVPRGASVAFVGPSGCGKSTLLKLVAGLVRATRGTVRVDGQPVEAPLKNVGMAFQNPVLLPWRSVLANLRLPFEILRENGDPRAADPSSWTRRSLAMLESVGLGGAGDRHPRELSGGMRQRVSLCRALIHEPELLLLDEPFAALDAFTREEMWELHQALRAGREVTTVLVTHDLREAVFLADVIYVMATNPGRIACVHEVSLPRPRALTDLYGREAQELVRLIHSEIRPERRTTAVAGA